ncbi:MAG: glycosyl transferase [Rhizobiaceae bacterium]|nr:glycosyl transferase [Rhizobiaceae bacterium]MCV0408576.1 glycosyl transferase [Rhizobiaceae bacterium]
MNGRRAYATLVTNADYAMGAEALIRSLRLTLADADIVVLYTGAAPENSLRPLVELGAMPRLVELLPTSDGFNERHARAKLHAAAPFTKGGKPAFHTPLDNFAKLRLWQMTEYDRIVFLDADTLVIRNIDRLFAYPEFSAAPNVYESLADFHRLNSGVFVAKPSEDTFEAMLDRIDQPDAFWRRTDQTFLETFFPDWHGLPVFDNMLQYVWFNLPGLWDWNSVRVIHYQYEKPWQDGHDKTGRLKPLIDLWRRVYEGGSVDPDCLTNPA